MAIGNPAPFVCVVLLQDPAPSARRIGGVACKSLLASSRRTTRRRPLPPHSLLASLIRGVYNDSRALSIREQP